MEKPKSKILKFFLLKERFRDGLRLLVETKQQKKKKKEHKESTQKTGSPGQAFRCHHLA